MSLFSGLRAAAAGLAALAMATPAHAETRPRAREAGIAIGVLPTGPLNAITDVAGVRVGHRTIVEGRSIRTGVTAVLPHAGNLFQDKVPAGFAVANGFGKFAGSTQVEELGELESPILLTNTLSVAEAMAAGVEWTLRQPGNEQVRSVNAAVRRTPARRAGQASFDELPNDAMSPLFLAAVESTEEAVLNSMFKAVTVESNGVQVEALPVNRVLELYRRHAPSAH